ncbi:MAG: septal ring lytic transglycosylase RlpA family protein [Acidobacteria bacterium]|nr:septal ring lytic transglycosylase RlpA family protein [Acidobacteriota bacterium]
MRFSPRPALAVFLAVLFAGGCAHRHVVRTPPPTPPPSPTPGPAPAPAVPSGPMRVIEEGNASWYGVPYHGRRAANGEIYDMHKLTAAHRTLPFETIVRVTNLRNGKHTQVRITDRGPFVEGRIIDLSLAAAREIDMVATGVARVRLEFVNGPPPMNGAFTVQVGAFLQKENAVKLRQRLERRYQPVFVHEYDSPKGLFYRVRVGRVASEVAADKLAEKLRTQESLTTFVVRLDE